MLVNLSISIFVSLITFVLFELFFWFKKILMKKRLAHHFLSNYFTFINNKSLTIFALYLTLNAAMMPASHGCNTDVVLGGNGCIVTFVSLLMKLTGRLWPPTLSYNNTTNLFIDFILLSKVMSHSWIQANSRNLN